MCFETGSQGNTVATDGLSERTSCAQKTKPLSNEARGTRMNKIQDWQAEGQMQVRKISTHNYPADVLPKATTHEKLVKFGYLR